MKIHEYQAKEILNKHNINTPKGFVASSLEESLNMAEKIGYPCVIKAQVHAGGRGKAGGIKFVKNRGEAEVFVKSILNTKLVTIQSGPAGQPINHVLIEEPSSIEKELYLGMVVDREYNKVCIIASLEGGMEIEEIAVSAPEKIIKQWVDVSIGIRDYHIRNLYEKLSLPSNLYKEFATCVKGLYTIFVNNDVSLIEINPLAINTDNKIIALDAKLVFDDNALYRLPHIMTLMDKEQENHREVLAQEYNLNYIALDGNIGCLVNGAGLAMSTMDIIKYAGGEPANFLDVGGGATKENVKEALKIILDDKNVKALLINVLGGIARCDVIAQGIVDAAKEITINVPMVVRLEGTKVDEGRAILKESSLDIISASDLLDAANKAVQSINNN
jgi:succinyl-CoA synthetase beta subunit